jgi:hypothetical protein
MIEMPNATSHDIYREIRWLIEGHFGEVGRELDSVGKDIEVVPGDLWKLYKIATTVEEFNARITHVPTRHLAQRIIGYKIPREEDLTYLEWFRILTVAIYVAKDKPFSDGELQLYHDLYPDRFTDYRYYEKMRGGYM